MASKEELQAIKDRVTAQDKIDRIPREPGISKAEHDALFILNAQSKPNMTAAQIEEEMTWAGYWALPEPEVKPTISAQKPPAVSNTVLQGGIRRSTGGLHTLSMAEIIAQANQADPTAVHFDPNSDHMRQVDPLAPHYDLSGDFPKLITPLKPGPKISGPA